jgi:hypothetical protein
MPEVKEVHLREQSQFRVYRKIFATLEGPAHSHAPLNLTPEQQAMFLHLAPTTFTSVPGGWGRLGCTDVDLASVQEALVKNALEAAWRNIAPGSLLKRVDPMRYI